MTHFIVSDVENTCYWEHAILKINLQIILAAGGIAQLEKYLLSKCEDQV